MSAQTANISTSDRLNGRVAVVTGGASGIGAQTAARLTADGAAVLRVDQKGDADLLLDVTADGASNEILDAVQSTHGKLDILVTCAGISEFLPLEETSDEVWDNNLSVNLTAVFRLVRDAAPLLKESQAGRVVTIGSVMSEFAGPGLAAYTASKHGLLGLSRALATELGGHGITVNCVQPGAIETPMTAPAFSEMPEYKTFWSEKAPLGRLGQPQDIADVIAFLVSDEARFMSGHGIYVDGAAMVKP
ncbi:short-chain dehydrogenase/reductase SDR [alpha proteobacterium IMCC14465]|uniref:Short-chain dehydrogenase/reductase SDR n=1 Tax=alpha proteobacterium IMCC14465 TaxID=1220535 RepID=J9A485_9PROT|nr:short-chain dehydrogenase/reductase SDR [alpha proteobacterium IMCC14465]